MNWAALHTGTRCGEAIAVGVAGEHIMLGERVAGDGDDPLYAGDVQIAVDEGGFVIIRGGILAGWETLPASDLVCWSWTGTLATGTDIVRAVHGRDDVDERVAHYTSALGHGNLDAAQLDVLVTQRRAALTAVPLRCPRCAAIAAAARVEPPRTS